MFDDEGILSLTLIMNEEFGCRLLVLIAATNNSWDCLFFLNCATISPLPLCGCSLEIEDTFVEEVLGGTDL